LELKAYGLRAADPNIYVMDLSISGKRRIDRPKRVEKDIWQGATTCYKHPEYRLPNTVFFIINITPHRGDGALLTGVPRLI